MHLMIITWNVTPLMPHSKYNPFSTIESTNGMAESQIMRHVMIDLKISRAVVALLVVRSKILTSFLQFKKKSVIECCKKYK